MMESTEIRMRFLNFFKKKRHQILKSSPLVPDDPSLLLTTAGMVQFKSIFEGKVKPTYLRAATCQRCLRTTDIDYVGKTLRHLTFFEMLGNFSFGDYFRKEAIIWAWEFLTETLKLDHKKIWVTVYKQDEETVDIWQKEVGIPKEKIKSLGEKDNFWSAGPTGSCGPCTELVFDLGKDLSCGRPSCGPDCDCGRFLEVWNLVFMEYDRDPKGKLHPLKKKGVDTGLGLERAALILQGKLSPFETDLFKPLIKEAASLAKVKYGENLAKDTSLKIVADHIRAITFLVSDGVLPSNEGRGYVLRRLLRRAVRHGRLLGIRKIFLPHLSETVIEMMGKVYPGVVENKAFIKLVLKNEEERFVKTLKSGLKIFNEAVTKTFKEKLSSKKHLLNKEVIFKLYDTYGFPPELSTEIAQEKGLTTDLKGFEKLMAESRRKTRATWREKGLPQVYKEVLDYASQTKFVGYEKEETEGKIQAIIRDKMVTSEANFKEKVEIVLDETPFYAEMGGQVGDKGLIETESGKVKVEDVKAPLGGQVYFHRGIVVEGLIKLGQKAKLQIDKGRREKIARNHTATHLLNFALRKVLGEHIKQAGSLVAPERLRFDFTHFKALDQSEIERVENLVNEKILENHPVRAYVTSFDFAKKSGALALFGEKYQEFVRVLEVGDFSKELCGGTHIARTGEIGFFKILSEGSIGTGLRRVEALSSLAVLSYFRGEEALLRKAATLLKTKPAEVPEKITGVLKNLQEKEKEVQRLEGFLKTNELEEILASVRKIDNFKVILKEIEAKTPEHLRSLVDELKLKLKRGVIVLGSKSREKALLVAAVTSDILRNGFHAAEILKAVSPILGGGGGGRADLAEAGGKNPEKLGASLKEAQKYIEKKIKESSQK